MEIGVLKKQALQSLKGRWMWLIGMWLGVSFASSIIINGISGAFGKLFPSPAFPDQIANGTQFMQQILKQFFYWIKIEPISFVLASLVVGPLTLGLYKAFLEVARGKKVMPEEWYNHFDDFDLYYFVEGQRWLKAWLSYLLTTIYTVLWGLLLIVPGVIKWLSYSMTLYILNDHPEYSVNQAITESRKMMKGHKWKLFVLYLSFAGWFLLWAAAMGVTIELAAVTGEFLWVSLVALVIVLGFFGWLLLMPYIQMTVTQFYLRISGQEAKVENVSTVPEAQPVVTHSILEGRLFFRLIAFTPHSWAEVVWGGILSGVIGMGTAFVADRLGIFKAFDPTFPHLTGLYLTLLFLFFWLQRTIQGGVSFYKKNKQ